jgi:hypothetical protein
LFEFADSLMEHHLLHASDDIHVIPTKGDNQILVHSLSHFNDLPCILGLDRYWLLAHNMRPGFEGCFCMLVVEPCWDADHDDIDAFFEDISKIFLCYCESVSILDLLKYFYAFTRISDEFDILVAGKI